MILHKGWIYESVGLYGSSELRRVDASSGEVIERHAIDEEFFGAYEPI
jgi:glutamine cyclotransferase